MPYVDVNNNVCGFIDIEEKENSNVFLRRYCLLDRQKNIVECYMDNPQNLPTGTRPVNHFNVQFISNVGDGKKHKPKEPFCFYFVFAGRNVFLRANDFEDKEQWIQILKDAATEFTVTMRHGHDEQTTQSLPLHNSAGPLGVEDSTGSYKVEVFGDLVIKTEIKRSASVNDVETIQADSVLLAPASPPPTDTWNPYNEQSEPIKTGYCIKQGQVRKNWKRRFFVLTPITISYYKDHYEKYPIKRIALADIIEARMSVGIHLNKDHVFEIVTGQRVFYVQTETATGRDSWITAINQCVDKLQKPRFHLQNTCSQTDVTLESWTLSRPVNSVRLRPSSDSTDSNHRNHTCQCKTSSCRHSTHSNESQNSKQKQSHGQGPCDSPETTRSSVLCVRL